MKNWRRENEAKYSVRFIFYTRALLAAIPKLDEQRKKPPAAAICAAKEPVLKEILSGHAVACHML